jgi:acyl-CoA reductase-like NAD-dependent aldehyde dehydrogenase
MQPMQQHDHYIDGAPAQPAGGAYFRSENPYTGQPRARVAPGDRGEVARAGTGARVCTDASVANSSIRR